MMRLRPPQSVRQRVIRHALNVLAIVTTLEVCCQFFVDIPTELLERDAEVGRKFVANFDDDVWNSESGRMIRIRTNELGFRGQGPSMPKPAKVRRVFVLGDSLIGAFQVAEEETLCVQLERILNAASADGPRWEVLNFGVTGSGTADQHVRYQRIIREWDPDLVLLCFGFATDLVDNHPRMSMSSLIRYDLDERGELVLIPDSSSGARAANLLNRHSALYGWQKSQTNQLIKQFKRDLHAQNTREWIFLDPLPVEIETGWKISAAILRQFHEDVRADGAIFCVAPIPTGRMIYDDQFAKMIEEGRQAGIEASYRQLQPERMLDEICSESAIPLIGLAGAFRARAPRRDSRIAEECLFYGGNGHLNVAGNRAAAESIAEFVLRQNWWTSRSPGESIPGRLALEDKGSRRN